VGDDRGTGGHEPPSVFEEVVRELLHACHRIHPEQLVPLLCEHLARLEMHDAVVYLVDVDQLLLVPFGGGESLAIDATLAGRAFRTEQILEGSADDENDGDATRSRLWIPIIGGAERLGILAVTVGELDDLMRERIEAVASLIAVMVISKLPYGDALVCARRLRTMDLAAELRWEILPPLTYVNDRVAIAGVLEPAYEVAGDSFDYALNGDLVHVAIIDAMGHGLEASLIANVAAGAYRNARRSGADLSGMFTAMDEVVSSQFGVDKFVTGQLGVLNARTGLLRWINAGHPIPILLRAHSVVGIELSPCLPIGMGDVPTTDAELALEPADTVLFFTDGVIEARSPDGQQFGRERLADLLVRAAAAGETLAETARKLCHAVLEHQQGRLQDDATFLLLRWLGPGVAP
jgi:hypothetical protein